MLTSDRQSGRFCHQLFGQGHTGKGVFAVAIGAHVVGEFLRDGSTAAHDLHVVAQIGVDEGFDQELRLQLNEGSGGCYGLHTDMDGEATGGGGNRFSRFLGGSGSQPDSRPRTPLLF